MSGFPPSASCSHAVQPAIRPPRGRSARGHAVKIKLGAGAPEPLDVRAMSEPLNADSRGLFKEALAEFKAVLRQQLERFVRRPAPRRWPTAPGPRRRQANRAAMRATSLSQRPQNERRSCIDVACATLPRDSVALSSITRESSSETDRAHVAEPSPRHQPGRDRRMLFKASILKAA